MQIARFASSLILACLSRRAASVTGHKPAGGPPPLLHKRQTLLPFKKGLRGHGRILIKDRKKFRSITIFAPSAGFRPALRGKRWLRTSRPIRRFRPKLCARPRNLLDEDPEGRLGLRHHLGHVEDRARPWRARRGGAELGVAQEYAGRAESVAPIRALAGVPEPDRGAGGDHHRPRRAVSGAVRSGIGGGFVAKAKVRSAYAGNRKNKQ